MARIVDRSRDVTEDAGRGAARRKGRDDSHAWAIAVGGGSTRE